MPTDNTAAMPPLTNFFYHRIFHGLFHISFKDKWLQFCNHRHEQCNIFDTIRHPSKLGKCIKTQKKPSIPLLKLYPPQQIDGFKYDFFMA
ncbi:hypothetical protein XI25_10560 [Paenibacillus sp. DMB20]|nr:hypothetical protein XI25_10560 [Paenibacillus sp. DMB20]